MDAGASLFLMQRNLKLRFLKQRAARPDDWAIRRPKTGSKSRWPALKSHARTANAALLSARFHGRWQ